MCVLSAFKQAGVEKDYCVLYTNFVGTDKFLILPTALNACPESIKLFYQNKFSSNLFKKILRSVVYTVRNHVPMQAFDFFVSFTASFEFYTLLVLVISYICHFSDRTPSVSILL